MLMKIYYNTLGEYKLLNTPCPNGKEIMVGSFNCQKCKFFIFKNKIDKELLCSFQDDKTVI
jgi:hypothetical protein